MQAAFLITAALAILCLTTACAQLRARSLFLYVAGTTYFPMIPDFHLDKAPAADRYTTVLRELNLGGNFLRLWKETFPQHLTITVRIRAGQSSRGGLVDLSVS